MSEDTSGIDGPAGRLIAYVGCYADSNDPETGGIAVVEVSNTGDVLRLHSRASQPQEAGYLVYAPSTRCLYAVDERKTDGRGPVQPPASLHALSVAGSDGHLTWLNALPATGPFPTFLDIDDEQRLLVGVTHGGFDHVEHIVRTSDGGWDVKYLYDDSALLLYELGPDGQLDRLLDVQVMTGHGKDPNSSPQAGGHGQASAHAHCAVIDPSRRYVLVADKGTDQIHVYRLGRTLEEVHSYQCAPESGPRHLDFDPTGNAFVTLEFASQLASFSFDIDAGELHPLDQVSTLAEDYRGPNEPADVRVHPSGRFVYVNNRGEDSLAWFEIGDGGRLTRRGHVSLARSIHPGLAARSFAFDPTGSFLLVADRPANLVRSYQIDENSGRLTPLAELSLAQPAFIAITELQP